MKGLKTLVILGILLALSLLLHIGIYGSAFTYESVSNSLFVVSTIVFLPSLVAITGAYEVFQGFNYSIRVLFSKNFRNQYPKFRDYKEVKVKNNTSWLGLSLVIATLIMILVSVILAMVHLYG